MTTMNSPYYPPRAGRFSRALSWLHSARRIQPGRARTFNHRTHWNGKTEDGHPLLQFLVPGAALPAGGLRRHRKSVMAIWLTLLALSLVGIGTAWASWAMVAAAVIHTVAVSAALTGSLTHLPRAGRAWRASLYAMLTVLVLYQLLMPWIIRSFVLPIRVQDSSVLINTAVARSGLKRGDWIAYRFDNGQTGFDRILALPGETVHFHPDAFEAGGMAYQRVAGSMPEEGSITLTESEYFVWPAGARYPAYGEAQFTAMLTRLSLVPRDRVTGRAYQRWLWRKQALEPLVRLADWTGNRIQP